ncbi:hypothetical protein [Pseudonocardia lacus]|uniref:hypothetical protein n=1 Tax=Pseudonocardia lacus TaxID=2835865 RepID=UPI001BDD96DC|nr:hypothetical protein [Pseudonocardia lacus]
MAPPPAPEPVPDPPPGPVPPDPPPPLRDRFNGAVGVLASVLAVLSFIVQPIEYLEGGETGVLGLWVLATTFTVAVVGTVMVAKVAASGRPVGWSVRVAQVVAPIALGVTLGLAVPLLLRSADGGAGDPASHGGATAQEAVAGGCVEPFVPLHRYALPRADGGVVHDVAVRSPGPGWQRGELIGCIRPFG